MENFIYQWIRPILFLSSKLRMSVTKNLSKKSPFLRQNQYFRHWVNKNAPLSIRLCEAVISAQRNPVEIRGYTLAFAASAFKTQPNALAEDLLKKMPSIEIERDGTIRAKGEDVKQILITLFTPQKLSAQHKVFPYST
jgi:hypothetical protein